jgi:hypothetical protein
MPDRG